MSNAQRDRSVCAHACLCEGAERHSPNLGVGIEQLPARTFRGASLFDVVSQSCCILHLGRSELPGQATPAFVSQPDDQTVCHTLCMQYLLKCTPCRSHARTPLPQDQLMARHMNCMKASEVGARWPRWSPRAGSWDSSNHLEGEWCSERGFLFLLRWGCRRPSSLRAESRSTA